MDGLEDRVVLSAAATPAISWVGGATGDWNVAGNWSGNAVPTASDDVEISGTATVTVNAAAQVNNLATDAGVTLVFNAGMGISGGGTFLNEGTISKPASGGASSIGIKVDNQGSILVGAGGTLNLAGGLANYTGTTLAGGTYEVSGTLGISGAISTLGGGTNVSLDGGSALIKNTTQTDPPFDNALRGLKTIKPGASLAIKDLALTMNQELTNEGNLKIQAGKLTLQDAFVNDGSITIGIAGPTSGVVGGYGVLEVATDGATLGGTLVAEFVNYTPSSFPESYSVINTGTRTSPDITGAIGFTQPTSLPPGVVMTRSTTPSGTQYYRGVNLTIDKLVLQSITVTPNNPGIAKGETEQFTATANYQGGTTADLTGYATWSAADKTGGPNVASIDAITGEAKGLNVGEATIAASYDGVIGSTILNVGQARLISLVVSPDAATIAKGQTATFTATGNYTDGSRDVTNLADWTPSNPSAVTFTAPGQARGDGVGSFTVTAALGGKSADAGLTVKVAEFLSLTISPTAESIAKGETATFMATAEYTDGSVNVTSDANAVWASSNAFASITAPGEAKGDGIGYADITVTFDGKTATAGLTVGAARLLSFTISPTSDLLYLGQTRQFTAMGHFTDGENREVTNLVAWGSSAPLVATIDVHGLATALTPGQTLISANYEGLEPVTAELNVAIQAQVSATSVSWGTMTAPLATAADGVRLLPSGRDFGETIGWAGINRINITLDHDAVLTAADIAVSSLAGINYGTVTVTGSGKNWVITLGKAIDVADRVTITIANEAVETFTRRLDVLPGDVNGDGIVSLQDVVYVRNGIQSFQPILEPIYFLDVVGETDGNGNPKLTMNSLTAVLTRFGTKLPSA